MFLLVFLFAFPLVSLLVFLLVPLRISSPVAAVPALCLAVGLTLLVALAACSNPERVSQAKNNATAPATIAPKASAPETTDKNNKTDNSDTTTTAQKQDKKSGSPRAVVAPLPEGLITASRTIVLPEPEGLQVGVLVPLAGRSAALGNALLDAIGLAVADHGGKVDEPLRFLVFDSGETPDTARQAAQNAVEAGVGLVLGPLFAAQAEAAGEILSPHGISLLTFSNDLRVARQGIFILGRTPQSQIAAIVAQAQTQGLYRFAIFSANDDLGLVAVESLRAFANDNQLELVAEGFHDASDPIASESVRYFLDRAQRYDVLLLTTGGRGLAGIANSFAFHDAEFDSVRLATFAGGAEISLRAEPALHGSWFAVPPEPLMTRFATRFENLLGYAPPAIAGTAYDAAAVAVLLYRDHQQKQKAKNTDTKNTDTEKSETKNTDTEKSETEKSNETQDKTQGETPSQKKHTSPWGVAALTRPQGFSGVAGLFRLRRDGGNERALAVYQATATGNQLLAPPPERFGDRAN